MNGNNRRAACDAIYFDSLGIKRIPKEIKKIIGNKNIITNIYRIQAFKSITCGYCFIWFFELMLKGKRLLDYKIHFFLTNMERMIK